ncbi:hypothetical protein MPC4_100103 [Methylocella tundrae]|uniref:Uncharacterized protein n=1 Tax=Methylocella tundrae TaxID=227605 RepID=A0A8B6M328_METTU|nr:hypothetical protein MPC4_100103 [Methylocella tundrae]
MHRRRDAARSDKLAKPREIIFDRRLDRNQQGFAFKSDAPVKVAGVIAKFDGALPVAWDETEPMLFGDSHDQAVTCFKRQNGAVEKNLIARQRNSDLLAFVGPGAQAASSDIGALQGQNIDAAVMLEMVQRGRKRLIEPASENRFDEAHVLNRVLRPDVLSVVPKF